MDPNRLLTAADACRFERAFRKLEPHHLSGWSLTGGIAIELHILRCGQRPVHRPLHDIDFIAAFFACIPPALGRELLVRHAHSGDPPARTYSSASIRKPPSASLWRGDVTRICA